MPKYSQVPAKLLMKALKKHGFEEHSWVGSHCTMKHALSGRRTTIPVHNKPLGKGLLAAILKQTGLTKDILD